ncbi:hypothetical protein E2562_032398, partial [Oryza meyeriana var. granulata]
MTQQDELDKQSWNWALGGLRPGGSNGVTDEEHNEAVWKARDYDKKPLGDGVLESL